MSDSARRTLPVVRWLQAGAVATGLGIAVVAAPAVAWADDDSSASAADSARQSAGRDGGAQRSTVQRSTRGTEDTLRANRAAGPARPAAATRKSAAEVLSASSIPAPSAATNKSPRPAAVPAPTVDVAVQGNAPAAALTTAKATTATAPSAAPGLGSIASTVRLNLEDLVSGTGRPVVTNPTAVVTGLFHEVLRRDPTAAELQNYLRRLKISGVNGVVAGLYNSQAFRQNTVNNYYLELLGRTPTQQELNRGTLRLTLGDEPMFAAALAGDQEFYAGSASGGGKFGTQPSATTYVKLLYRSLLGQAVGPAADPLIQQVQGGLPIARAANQFVRTDAYRAVKVGEVYSVLGQAAAPTDIAAFVDNWVWSGGQAGISMSLLATAANIQRIEAGLVTLPDMAAAADLQKLLLAAYTDSADGFTKLFNEMLSLDPLNPISAANPCTASNVSCNQALYTLVTAGGLDRGIPNSALTPKSVNADVSTLIPTQNEIDLSSSLIFPLQNANTLKTFFAGGLIGPTGRLLNPIVTADDGTYIVDGHHRWSQLYLINPYTQIVAVDVGYVPTPQTALKEAQFGVIAAKGYLKSTGIEGENIYTIPRELFDTRIVEYIAGGDDSAAVRKVFGDYLMFDSVTLPLEEQYTIIQDYLWDNVLRMRNLNPYIPGAPVRAVMPQTDPSPIWQNYMGSGRLSYSFPTISYLG